MVGRVNGDPSRKWSTDLLCDLHELHHLINSLYREYSNADLIRFSELGDAFERRARFIMHLPRVPYGEDIVPIA
jgi:hypothetical protein